MTPLNPDDSDDKSPVEPFYLYDGSTGVNKLGEITVGGYYNNTSSYKLPTLSLKNNYIETTLEKGYICDVNFLSNIYNFGISDINQYSKLVIEYELISGKFNSVYFGYMNSKYQHNGDGQVGVGCAHLTEDDDEKSLFDRNNIVGYDIDSIQYIKHINLDQWNGILRELLMATSTKYPATQFRLGFFIVRPSNKVIDSIFRIYKIWLE